MALGMILVLGLPIWALQFILLGIINPLDLLEDYVK
jgi:hypothetical protein